MVVRGNALNNTLIGVGNGRTYLDGGPGADTLIGGMLDDTYIVDNLGDTIVEKSNGQGMDTVQSSVSYTLSSLENLQLIGSDPISGTGNAWANQLDGSMNSAANVLAGDLGNDTYLVGVADTVVEAADAGTDSVVINAGPVGTYTLNAFANVENLALGYALNASNLTGNDGDNQLQGNNAANSLTGELAMIGSGAMVGTTSCSVVRGTIPSMAVSVKIRMRAAPVMIRSRMPCTPHPTGVGILTALPAGTVRM